MIQEDDKIQKSRIRGAHITTIFSIALVLFLLGVQALILGYTREISNYVKENIGFTVVIKEFTREQDILDMQKMIENSPCVKSVKYVSSDEAAKVLQDDLGHDFIDFLGYNPLLPSIEVHLKAEYMQSDSIAAFEKEITRYHLVKEMFYQKDLVSIVNDNVRTISLWLIGISALILCITILLINNTMRLLIYSKRFIINSMQLVGATSTFIRKPFILKSMLQGISGALISIAVLASCLLYLNAKIPDIVSKDDIPLHLTIAFIILGLSLIITSVSAYFSVNKYIRMRNSDQIYH